MKLCYYFAFLFFQHKGVSSLPPMVIFTSCDAHYSIKKMAALLGIGQDRVILVNTDLTGSMDVVDLKNCIETSIKENSMYYV